MHAAVHIYAMEDRQMKKFRHKKLLAVLAALTAAATVSSCAKEAPERLGSNGNAADISQSESAPTVTDGSAPDTDVSENSSQQPESETQDSKDDLPPTSAVSFVCAGDNLIHDNIYVEALEKGGGDYYDFTDCYANVKKYIEGADIAVLNQETLVTDAYEPSSYPQFCSPPEVADAVTALGFNVISMSNNHVLDKYEDGLISSLDFWDKKGVLHYGAYRSQEDADNIRTMEVNGITFAFLGYTEHTNGLSADGARIIYLSELDTIERQIREADELADVVVVSCHYGTEVLNELNSQQISLTPMFVEWGADLIIGTQSHCISTCEYLDKPDGGQAFVYYGLGNFLHTMYDVKSIPGIIGSLDVVKDNSTGEVSFENVKAIPVISHFEADSYNSYWYNCKLYPYKDYTDELLQKHYMYRDGLTRQSIEQCLSYIPQEFLSIE